MLIKLGESGLASCSYAISPLIETHTALRLLSGVDPAGAIRPWVERRRARLAELRRAEPKVGALIAMFRKGGYNADFLLPPPIGPHSSFAGELAGLRATPLALARTEIDLTFPGRQKPGILDAPEVVDALADAFEMAWHTLIEPEWPRLRAVLERDIVQRAGRLAAYGWASALDQLHPRVTWAGGGIAIRMSDPEVYEVKGQGLMFTPSIFSDLIVRSKPPQPFTIVYRARGIADLLGPPVPPHDDALGPLLGAGRAAVLRALAAPATTSQLVAQLGVGLGTVGGHLAVLHAAGLVSRTRTGRSVTYAVTDLGLSLLA
ncbi:ArsR family transcriptional regulator [Actinoplanes sp. NPDC089786]|uniref:ArsR family transcriptional regulator n=1 Tax=Actinoplanes sp. NPDC089786 TaxID=3155185 RepID=UPI0034146320